MRMTASGLCRYVRCKLVGSNAGGQLCTCVQSCILHEGIRLASTIKMLVLFKIL